MHNDFETHMNFFCRAHPWHGVEIGENSPTVVNCYVEIVPTDTVKFELDKTTGLLKADRPQKYSNYCPSLYGLIPRTHAGKRVGAYCGMRLGREDIVGDNDPIDVCILTEKEILRGDILVAAVPIGGIRALDGNESDDKIIAVLKDDLIYGGIRDIDDCPPSLIERLCHYFLTYKDFPESLKVEHTSRRMKITEIYSKEEAHDIIRLSQLDYEEHFQMLKEQKLKQQLR